MYLHIGGDKALLGNDIVGIFDMDSATVSNNSREFLNRAQKSGSIVNISDDLPKSFIVTGGSVYLCPVATSTIKKRSTGSFSEITDLVWKLSHSD